MAYIYIYIYIYGLYLSIYINIKTNMISLFKKNKNKNVLTGDLHHQREEKKDFDKRTFVDRGYRGTV